MTVPIIKVNKAQQILAHPFKGEYGLSPRQIEALEYALKGMPTSLMAAEMNIPEGTVKQHMFRALGKLGISKSELGWWVLDRLRETLG
jgi:DNA-binding CsgD family transcriptional regulator